MKKTLIVAVIALTCAGLSPVRGGKTGEAEAVALRPTPDELARRMAERTKPLAGHRGLKPVDPESIQRRQAGRDLGGLLERSTILAYGNYWTLVPKGSILHVPPAFRERLGTRQEGVLIPWSDFYARNRGWLFTQPVSISLARGEATLSEAVVENHQKLGRVVIAVLHNGPISVKPAEAAAPVAPPRPNHAPSRTPEAP